MRKLLKCQILFRYSILVAILNNWIRANVKLIFESSSWMVFVNSKRKLLKCLIFFRYSGSSYDNNNFSWFIQSLLFYCCLFHAFGLMHVCFFMLQLSSTERQMHLDMLAIAIFPKNPKTCQFCVIELLSVQPCYIVMLLNER